MLSFPRDGRLCPARQRASQPHARPPQVQARDALVSLPVWLPLALPAPPLQGCKCGGYDAYGQSKLALVMFTYRLSRLLKERMVSAVTANAIDPGTINTKLLYSGWGGAADIAMPAQVRTVGRGQC